MKLEVIDPNQLTYKQILEGLDDMYMLVPQDPAELGIMDRTKPIPELEPFRIFGDERDDGEKIIFKVIFDENDTPSSNAEEMPFPEETVESRDKPLRTNIRMDYKINAESHDKSIFVEVRPKGDIRVSFKDHEDAKVYHEYFRDLFYRAYSECDAVTVATIYSELHLDLDEISRRDPDFVKKCESFGWLTLDHGPCKYISEKIAKTKHTDMLGFNLKKPIKLYFRDKEMN